MIKKEKKDETKAIFHIKQIPKFTSCVDNQTPTTESSKNPIQCTDVLTDYIHNHHLHHLAIIDHRNFNLFHCI